MGGLGAILGGGLGAIGGAYFGNPWVGAGVGSSLGNMLEGSDPTVQTTTQSRSTTPYQVRLADGTVITLYAHGPTSEETVTEGGDTTGDAIAAGLGTFGMMKAQGANTVGDGLGGASTKKLVTDPGAFSLGDSAWLDDYLQQMARIGG